MLTDVKLQHYSYRDVFEASMCHCITRQIYTICARLELRECDAGGPAERAASRLLLCEVRRSSGLDVREACVSLTAAGRGAQVPRATAF